MGDALKTNFEYKVECNSLLQQHTLPGYASGDGSTFSLGLLHAETFYDMINQPRIEPKA